MKLIEFLATNHIDPTFSDIFYNIEVVDNFKKYQPTHSKPKKPVLPTNPTSLDAKNFASELEVYETLIEEWKKVENENKMYNMEIDSMILDYIKEESGLNNLNVSDKVKNNTFSKAWCDGHSSGYVEVYYHLLELVEMQKD